MDLNTSHMHAILTYAERVVSPNGVCTQCSRELSLAIKYEPLQEIFILTCGHCQHQTEVALNALADWWAQGQYGSAEPISAEMTKICEVCGGKTYTSPCPSCRAGLPCRADTTDEVAPDPPCMGSGTRLAEANP